MRVELIRPINPVLFRASQGAVLTATIAPDGLVSTESSGSAHARLGTRLSAPVAGVVCWYHDPGARGGWVLGFLDDAEHAENEREKRERAETARRAEEERKRVRDAAALEGAKRAAAFNAELGLPFPWAPAYKGRLNMFREYTTRGRMIKSFSGFQRDTVTHIMLESDFMRGRFGRKTSDLLCVGSDHGRWGAERGGPTEMVTCKACLLIARRLRSSAIAVVAE